VAPVSQLDDGIVQTVFHHQATHERYVLPESGVELDPRDLYSGTSKFEKFDLWLSMAGNETGLAAMLEYERSSSIATPANG
jgi:hypothetical protein